MFPLRDENPTLHTPYVTYLFIAINLLVWGLVQGFGAEMPLARSLCLHAMIPAEVLHTAQPGTVIPMGQNMGCSLEPSSWFSLITHQFMHGGWFHLISNMWFLWIFGDNVEDVMGPFRFIVFYLLCGLAAAVAQLASDPQSVSPMVGASGAIGGVLGAYARLYPQARIQTVIFLGFFFTMVSLPAVAMLGYWFILQLAGAAPGLKGEGGIAFWAHIGGFLAGVALSKVFLNPDYYIERIGGYRF